jgi:hypothetical protein
MKGVVHQSHWAPNGAEHVAESLGHQSDKSMSAQVLGHQSRKLPCKQETVQSSATTHSIMV